MSETKQVIKLRPISDIPPIGKKIHLLFKSNNFLSVTFHSALFKCEDLKGYLYADEINFIVEGE